jgi:hypothetical protein
MITKPRLDDFDNVQGDASGGCGIVAGDKVA